MSLPLIFSTEVATARSAGHPIVALESTIITHGMPYPQNYATARVVEREVRNGGATPATVAVMDGAIHIGLETAELESLAQTTFVRKLSRADLAACIAVGATGATTVAATMVCARLAGIAVFATGGIGGVHRGAQHSLDVSADLYELSKSPITVVAAGAKAILDIPKTLEVLETLGVPVITVGSDDFPAFWSHSSGIATPLRMDHIYDIAASHHLRRSLGLGGGQLVANPIPLADEIPAVALEPVIERALAEATRKKISQKAVTPYVLAKIFDLTRGRSLDANIALVRNNALLAAKIAREISDQDETVA